MYPFYHAKMSINILTSSSSIFRAEVALKSRGFGGFDKTSGEVMYVKSFVSTTYEA
jgi:hypothetical protein